MFSIVFYELYGRIYYCKYLADKFEMLYFGRRVLSVLESNDIPIRVAAELLDNVDIIEALYEDKDKYISESDSDTDILNYVIEYGYRHYAEIVCRENVPKWSIYELQDVFCRKENTLMRNEVTYVGNSETD